MRLELIMTLEALREVLSIVKKLEKKVDDLDNVIDVIENKLENLKND